MDRLDPEMVIIENTLHNSIKTVQEMEYATPKEKEKAIEEVFESFYNELQTYKGCTKLKEMSLEEIKEIYFEFQKSLNQSKEYEDDER